MSSTNRSRAKAGSVPRFRRAAATAFALLAFARVPALAQPAPVTNNFWFSGTRLAFEHPQVRDGAFAIGTDDNGLSRFLSKVGATLSYQPGQRYVIITAADRRLITFTLGDPHYVVGTVTQSAPFAPYVAGGVAYLPFLDLARALYVDPVNDGQTVVMQPQIGALDVRTESSVTLVTLHGASPLQFKRLTKADEDTISLAFLGTGSTLETDRAVSDSPLRGVSITVGGTPKNPTTVVNFSVVPGGSHVLAPSESANSLTLAFAPTGVQLGGTAVPASGGTAVATAPLTVNDPRLGTPVPSPPAGAYRGSFRTASPTDTLPPYGDSTSTTDFPASAAVPAPVATQTPTAQGLATAAITGLDTQSVDNGFNIKLGISGPVTYEWHRLSDDRWYVDFKPATLSIPAQEQPLTDPSIVSLRIKPFVGPNDHLPTVRVAFTMPSARAVNLIPSSDGMTIAIDSQDDAGTQTAGTGELANGNIVASVVPLPVVAAAPPLPAATDASWKFAQPAGVRNPRLIVIDPGHGGSDDGAEHNGLTEKTLNLDVSRRLRAILIARGWEVKMTRDSDVDVYQPNDSARDELQARDDIANKAGARLLISIHTNSFTSSDLNGTTTYYYTSSSLPLARAVHARLAATLPTQDDGVRKENFYVIHHQNMPGILVEMAFLSNPGDAKLLKTSAFLQSMATCIADGVGDYTSGNAPVSDSDTDGN